MSKSLYSYLGLNVTSSSSTSISLALSSFLSINTVRNSFIVNLGLLGSCNIRYTYIWFHHIYLQLVYHIYYSWFITYITVGLSHISRVGLSHIFTVGFITYITVGLSHYYSWSHHIYLQLVYHIYLQLVASHMFTVSFYHIHVCLNLFFLSHSLTCFESNNIIRIVMKCKDF